MDKFFFSQEDFRACKEFSECVNTSFYANRNQFDDVKRKADSLIGKIAEVAVYNLLKDKYPNISYPDFKIYKAKEKSWDYDLKDPTFNLHVKSVSSVSNFPESWIFQNEDKHIFKNYLDNDYVAFVYVNMFQKYGLIKKILPIKLLHDKNLFKKTVLAKLNSKSAIYYDDIKTFDNYLL